MAKKLLIAAVAVAGVIVLAAIGLALFLDANQFRPALAAKMGEAIGRRVEIGNLKISWLAGGVAAEDVVILDDPSFSKDPFVSAKSVSIGVDVMPLIMSRSLRVEFAGNSDPAAPAVSQLVLVEPGARYRLSFSARAKDLVTGGLPFVQVNSASKGGEALAASPDIAPDVAEWRDYAVEFAAPAGVEAIRIDLKRRPCTSSPCPAFGSVWLDSVGLKRL